MKNLQAAVAAGAAVLLLGGCAATVRHAGVGSSTDVSRIPAAFGGTVVLLMTSPHDRSADWESFKGEWRAAFRGAAERSGIGFESLEPGGTPRAAKGTLVKLTINDYRYLTSGARYGFGIMTGNAYIDAHATFVDIASGRLLAARDFATTSTAWEGIFSAMTDKQVAAITDTMFRLAGERAANQAAKTQEVAGAPPPTPAPTTAEQAIGQEAFQIERMPEARACSATPRAVLTKKGPGFELYTVACSSGDSLVVRCEFTACRVLR